MKKTSHRPGKIFFVALANLFHKPATTALPAQDKEANSGSGYRGRLIYDPTNCIDCRLCMRDCPANAISIKNLGTKEEKDMHAYLNVGHCIFCGQCVDSCPKKCLSSSTNILLSGFSREELEIEL